jgi:hypothetical protein
MAAKGEVHTDSVAGEGRRDRGRLTSEVKEELAVVFRES